MPLVMSHSVRALGRNWGTVSEMTTQPSSGATKNDQGKELVSTAVLAVVLRLASASLSFLLSAAVARVLGAQGAGLYFLALSITMFATVVAQLGFEGTILRFVSADAAKEAWSEMRGVVRYIVRLITLVSGSIGLLIFLLAWPISTTFFDKPNLAGPW